MKLVSRDGISKISCWCHQNISLRRHDWWAGFIWLHLEIISTDAARREYSLTLWGEVSLYIADLQFYWFKFNQTGWSVDNYILTKLLNPKQSNRRSAAVQGYFPLQREWVLFSAAPNWLVFHLFDHRQVCHVLVKGIVFLFVRNNFLYRKEGDEQHAWSNSQTWNIAIHLLLQNFWYIIKITVFHSYCCSPQHIIKSSMNIVFE